MNEMMSTAVRRQTEAFGDVVMAAHREAMEFWSVQDIALMGPGVAGAVANVVRARTDKGGTNDSDRDALADACRTLLAVFIQGQRLIQDTVARGFDVEGASAYRDAIVEMRELLASLSGAGDAGDVRPADDVAKAAETMPPPQSWFEEDLTGLRGPG